jgi:hypothetical protein
MSSILRKAGGSPVRDIMVAGCGCAQIAAIDLSEAKLQDA